MMADGQLKADILVRLHSCADAVDDVPVKDLEALLREAAETIATLRLLVGIREEVELEDMPPEGNA